jgi:prevent-host-death family protein
MTDWQIQKAKAKLSEVLSAAQDEPQIITRHGAPVAAVVSYEEYLALRQSADRPTLVSFLRSWPVPFDVPPRDKSLPRDIEL